MKDFDFPTWLDILGLIGLIGTAIVTLRSTAVRLNVKAQKELIDTLNEKVKSLEESRDDSIKTIKDLQGKIAIVESLPLKALAESQADIAKTQKDILTLLQSIQGEITK